MQTVPCLPCHVTHNVCYTSFIHSANYLNYITIVLPEVLFYTSEILNGFSITPPSCSLLYNFPCSNLELLIKYVVYFFRPNDSSPEHVPLINLTRTHYTVEEGAIFFPVAKGTIPLVRACIKIFKVINFRKINYLNVV